MGSEFIGAAKDEADGAGAARGKAQGAGIGAIAQLVCRVGDAQARGLLDFGIAIERAAYCCLRQAEMFGEVFQSHSG